MKKVDFDAATAGQGRKFGQPVLYLPPFHPKLPPLEPRLPPPQITTLKRHDDKGTAQKYHASLGESPGPAAGQADELIADMHRRSAAIVMMQRAVKEWLKLRRRKQAAGGGGAG